MESSEGVAETALTPIVEVASGQELAEGISAHEFEGIVRRHQQRVFRVLYALLRDHDAADTLTQECFLRAYRKRQSFRGEASIGTWLVRIALNLARDHARNRRLAFWKKLLPGPGTEREEVRAFEFPDPSPSPERALIARERVNAVWAVMEKLSGQQRTAFLLRFVEEMTLEEIAQTMELEVGTVKTHLHRAVSAVRKELKEPARR